MFILSSRRVANFWQLMRKWFKREHMELKDFIGVPATDLEIYAMFAGDIDSDGDVVVGGDIDKDGYLVTNFIIDENGIITFN